MTRTSDLKIALERILEPENVKTSLLDRMTFASDAGFYQLIPQAVVFPHTESQLKSLFHFSHTHKIPLVFRAGGTSLSGQSITDGILVEIGRHWKRIEPLENGKLVRVQPGAIGAMVNAHLKKYGTKIGPDPSSIASAMMGGILSNNSSGMCCGVQYNAYHTLHHIRFMLPDGSIWDTSQPQDYQRFEKEQPHISLALLSCKKQIESNPSLLQKIRSKYQTKNTVGYGLNALLDYNHPLDILAHLLIGAEGTLACILEATLRTIPDLKHKETAFLFFSSITDACSVLPALIDLGAEALELMDYASLRSVRHIKGIPDILHRLPEGASALLIEFQAADEDTLHFYLQRAQSYIDSLPLLQPCTFTHDPYTQNLYWKIRKGMFPAVGAVRARGTTVILEDVAFPVHVLGAAITDLQNLFKKHHYDHAIIFGHAKDGNIHFVITQKFENEKDTLRYKYFIDDVVHLVVQKYGGALKAEHGTGRNMAPFVETEWGKEAYDIMVNIKSAVDKACLLNPGVIINSDAEIHLKNLKKLPEIEAEVDKCIECGACESKCPSHDITMSPRRRIVARRRIKEFADAKNQRAIQELLTDYTYQSQNTCSVDGMCAVDCPVDINTGDLVKHLRQAQHSKWAQQLACFVQKRFALFETLIGIALSNLSLAQHVLGAQRIQKLSAWAHNLVPMLPLIPANLRKGKLNTRVCEDYRLADAIYFPTCISRMMGGDVSGGSVIDTLISVGKKVGLHISVPKDVKGTCCGQAFGSKGYTDASAMAINETIKKLYDWSNKGQKPIIMDLTSCTYTVLKSTALLTKENAEKAAQLLILDAVDWCAQYVLPRMATQPVKKKQKVVLHPVCSVHKMGTVHIMQKVAQACAHEVIVPKYAGCCGMAGDRGFFFPELTTVSTKHEAQEVINEEDVDGYYSSARSCEISLSEATGKAYTHIVYLLDAVLE